MKSRLKYLLLTCLLSLGANAVHAVDIEGFRRLFEQVRLEQLAELQANTAISAFTTDGCSGGLSAGWYFLADKLPVFRRKFGERPPYEDCCEAHDKAYWQGEAEGGYQKRLEADERLRQCVFDTGLRIKAEVANEFGLSEQVVESNFRIISELMYQAVRVGGVACSYLPWRWGYGWAQCPVF